MIKQDLKDSKKRIFYPTRISTIFVTARTGSPNIDLGIQGAQSKVSTIISLSQVPDLIGALQELKEFLEGSNK